MALVPRARLGPARPRGARDFKGRNLLNAGSPPTFASPHNSFTIKAFPVFDMRYMSDDFAGYSLKALATKPATETN